jgi:fructuronate reductase
MRYAIGRTDAGEAYALRDPREDEIRQAAASGGTAAGIVAALQGLDGLFPAALADAPRWRNEVTAILGDMLDRGVTAALAAEAARAE